MWSAWSMREFSLASDRRLIFASHLQLTVDDFLYTSSCSDDAHARMTSAGDTDIVGSKQLPRVIIYLFEQGVGRGQTTSCGQPARVYMYLCGTQSFSHSILDELRLLTCKYRQSTVLIETAVKLCGNFVIMRPIG